MTASGDINITVDGSQIAAQNVNIGHGNVIRDRTASDSDPREQGSPPPSESIGKHVFVSYSRGDQPTVIELCDRLQATATETWLDRSDIQAGDDWWATIRDGIDTAKAVLVVLSTNSERQGWTIQQSEIIYVIQSSQRRPLKIIPVRLNDCAVPAIPLTVDGSVTLAELDYVDFFLDPDVAVERIVQAIPASG